MELRSSEKLAICYHDIFDYPLTKEELKKWSPKKVKGFNLSRKISTNGNYYFVNGRKFVVKKRLKNEKYSKKKLQIAVRASKLMSLIPTIKMVGITGALAMNNAARESDIDFLVVTKNNTLWLTRPVVYILLWLFGYKSRISFNTKTKYKNIFEYIVALFEILRTFDLKIKDEKDRFCINMWLDEYDLTWDKKDRNIYTAHEILQVVPIVNKDNTFDKFLSSNQWVTSFWSNKIKTEKYKIIRIKNTNKLLSFIEVVCFKLQHNYMKSKIVREIVTPTRAIFHPNDWGRAVISKLAS